MSQQRAKGEFNVDFNCNNKKYDPPLPRDPQEMPPRDLKAAEDNWVTNSYILYDPQHPNPEQLVKWRPPLKLCLSFNTTRMLGIENLVSGR